MLGMNAVAKARDLSRPFLVHSIFYTIQGEGPFAGIPAIFLRMGGCNLRCFWCDTEFEEGAEEWTLAALREKLLSLVDKHRCSLIVVTGGEPMLQPIGMLIQSVSRPSPNIRWQIETAGTVWPAGGFPEPFAPTQGVSIVVSPKTPQIAAQLETAAKARGYLPGNTHLDIWWKYILRADEPTDSILGLPCYSTQDRGQFARKPLFVPTPFLRDRVFVQACDQHEATSNAENLAFATKTALRHGYRISVQIHKLLNVE